MKKTIFSIMALAMAMVSCTNEEIITPAEQYGYINVNVTNEPLEENVAQTRATVSKYR